METLELAQQIAEEANETKAKDLKVLDLRGLVSYTDFFVLATGTSDRHVQAIAERVHQKIKKKYTKFPLSYEGLGAGQWVLLDYGDVVLHIFLSEQRDYYGLDELWGDAPEIDFFGTGKKTVRKKKPSPPAKRKAPAKKKKKRKETVKKRR